MEYKFKLTLNEYSTALKLLGDIDTGRIFMIKLVKRCVVWFCLFLNIIYTLMYGLKALLLLGSICGVMLFLFFYFLRPEHSNKKRLKLVTKKVAKNPEILDWQSVAFEEDSIIYNFNKKSLKTKLANVERVIEEDDVILIVDCDNDLCAIIPCSYFTDISDKKEFLNKVKGAS
ncbi:hypothetical protein QOZ84_02045 [Romboutsia sedimentorum]|uniref:YcxB-like protein domain-containing protein n=1 Tax=Romboutsia sedimentorum TaxID=1368474 RepID=A0ABT7E9Y1_9FIRM|nr:hypothetical protein [Romboutsia sedimentorum]MDK2562315.1 hypothetical protein [Romboutsia sedimentorum]